MNHPNFGIPNIMKYVSIGSCVFWLLGLVNPTLLSLMQFSPYHILHGQVWRLLTFIFYPPSTGLIAFIAIYFYYYIGSTLEKYWGTPEFNLFLCISAGLTILYGFLMYFIFGINVQITLTYTYLSMFFAFATLFPDMQVLLFMIIPVKMKYLAYLDAGLFLYSFVTTSFPLNFLPVVALAGFLIFCGPDLWARRTRRATKETINFRKESQRIRRQQEAQLYRHKCAVCGKTDTEYPNLEFRYCSRCQGYHCFCQEHISNHIHFTE